LRWGDDPGTFTRTTHVFQQTIPNLMRNARMTKFLTAGLLGMLVLGMGLSPALAGKGQKKRDPAQVFQKLDANGDKTLTLEELKGKGKKDAAKVEKNFKRMDRNSDGKVSLEELKGKGKGKKKSKKNA
jgi:hypothetical protein